MPEAEESKEAKKPEKEVKKEEPVKQKPKQKKPIKKKPKRKKSKKKKPKQNKKAKEDLSDPGPVSPSPKGVGPAVTVEWYKPELGENRKIK